MKILNSKIIGNKPPHLIIIHGLFGQLDNWNTLGKKYSEYFTTHLVDLRNHGRSFHDNDTSHQAMAQDLIHYLRQHDIEKANFIGHSLGGKVVMQLALSQPKNVDKLIVADMAPKNYPPHHQGIIKGLESVDFEKVKSRAEVEDYMLPYIKEVGVRQFLLKNVYRKEDGTYAYRFNLNALSEDYDNLISNHLPNTTFLNPTLFLGGEFSSYITPEDEITIKKYFPNAIINTISKSGHWLHAENPSEFLEKTLQFLA